MHRRAIQAVGLTTFLLACSASPPSVAAGAERPFTVEALASFNNPWAIAFLPDGSALVTQKSGELKLWKAGQPVRDVAGVPKVLFGGQGGLLDVVRAPTFDADRTIYLSYSEPSSLGGSSLALARATLHVEGGAASLQNLKVVWRDPAGGKGGQFGGRIAFAPDNKTLFLTSGERQRFTPAQDPDQPLGKILHLTLDGKPAPGNPAAGKTGKGTVQVTDPPRNTGAAASAPSRTVQWPGANLTPAETWSSGHRTPYGLAFDAAGRLWETEMGPQGGDELNLIEPGKNYGWPRASNGSNYDDTDIPDHKPGDGFAAPKVWWNPSVSPAGLMIYRGGAFPQWKGDAFIPTLSGQALIRIHLSGTAASKSDQLDMGARIRAVQQGPGGNIYLLEDGSPGRLLRLDPVKR